MTNGQFFDPTRIDADPRPRLDRDLGPHRRPLHPVHLHGAHFRILKRNGPHPNHRTAAGRTPCSSPTDAMRLAVTFTGHRGKYVFHCHNLEHEDAGMMANMEIQ